MFSTTNFKNLKVLFVLFCVSFSTFAQKDSTRRNNYFLWTNIGGNIGLSTNSTFLLGLQFGLNCSLNQKHYFKINLYASGTAEGLPFPEAKPNKLRYIKNISFQYGLIHYNSKSAAIILSGGVSCGEALWRGKFLYYDKQQSIGMWSNTGNIYELDNYSYWGIPIDLTLLWTTPRNGFSIDAFVNFHKHSDYGLRLNYNIGKLRTRPTKNI
jgi:hypothetical protein